MTRKSPEELLKAQSPIPSFHAISQQLGEEIRRRNQTHASGPDNLSGSTETSKATEGSKNVAQSLNKLLSRPSNRCQPSDDRHSRHEDDNEPSASSTVLAC